ncbi:tripartite motif protein, putative [Plasmodium relictum]|uniref:Tripartite motif protein, putative n=1 Tax=Plasmodium relictum TaxID=85471 RepID=A0A1J1HBK1_PLARL|nr:tripartite motif protein, putative [Plasmodium relictum]CRH02327.1 tripartite motif protein, putative [Plasmodium relictum]
MDKFSLTDEDTNYKTEISSNSLENNYDTYKNCDRNLNKNISENESFPVDNKKAYKCISCSRTVDDVLVLSCKHLMCLVCASLQLQEKYEKILKKCSKEKKVNILENHNINECFINPKDTKKAINDDKIDGVFKKEKLGYITCFLCDIKNKLTIETIEVLTKIGLISSDVLNVHTIFFNSDKDTQNKNNEIKEEYIKKMAIQLNDTLNSDCLKNENLKKLLISSKKYNYIDEQIDDLNKYSYICNICSYNEAVIYCKDCVEYLCKECCNNIHELDILKKLKMKNYKTHDYYDIDKNVINLKKIVKEPKKVLKITQEDIEIISDTNEESFHEKDLGSNCKIYDDESDFDNYDEKHFYERQKRFIEKEEKKKKNINISNNLNNLVQNMKNESNFESDNSSIKGTIGSTCVTNENSVNIKKKKKKRKMMKKIYKKLNNESNILQIKKNKEKGNYLNNDNEKKGDIYCLTSKSEFTGSSDESMYYSNSDKEIGITNIKNILDNNLEKPNENPVNSKDFTSIQNIRCHQHFNYPIHYFCHTCCTKCFCSECAINGTHTNNCNIENINNAFITILNKYLIKWNEIISDLINDLDRNFYESLEDTKNEWSLLLSECYCDLNSKVSYIVNNLSKKEKEIFQQFDSYMENFKKENLEYIDLLYSKYEDIEKTIKMIRDNKFQNNPINIIKFYQKNINFIDKTMLLNNDFKPIENLSKIRESKIFYMDLYASQIMSYLRFLQSFLNQSSLISSS